MKCTEIITDSYLQQKDYYITCENVVNVLPPMSYQPENGISGNTNQYGAEIGTTSYII